MVRSGNRHEILLANIYDLTSDPCGLRGKFDSASERELAIINEGFDGYRTESMAVVLGTNPIPVDGVSKKIASKSRTTTPARVAKVKESQKTKIAAKVKDRAIALNKLAASGVSQGSLLWDHDAKKWESASRVLRRTCQDRMIDARGIVEEIERASGAAVADTLNLYHAENLMHGKAIDRSAASRYRNESASRAMPDRLRRQCGRWRQAAASRCSASARQCASIRRSCATTAGS